jgi:hypothetical protein
VNSHMVERSISVKPSLRLSVESQSRGVESFHFTTEEDRINCALYAHNSSGNDEINGSC